MSEIVIIDSGQLALSLRLPELGMPEILCFGSEPVEADPLFEIERSSRGGAHQRHGYRRALERALADGRHGLLRLAGDCRSPWRP